MPPGRPIFAGFAVYPWCAVSANFDSSFHFWQIVILQNRSAVSANFGSIAKLVGNGSKMCQFWHENPGAGGHVVGVWGWRMLNCQQEHSLHFCPIMTGKFSLNIRQKVLRCRELFMQEK